jgi:hypothetical protein
MQNGATALEKSLVMLQKLRTVLPQDSAITFLGIYTKK